MAIVSVCTTAAESTLASLSDLMVLMNTTASSSGLDLALQSATAWVERHITNEIGGCIRRHVVAETVSGLGGQRLLLSRRPVQAIQRMFGGGTDTGTATEYCATERRLESQEAGFLEAMDDGGFADDAILRYDIGRYPQPGPRLRRWMVVYEAGWQYTPATSTSEYVTTSTVRTLPEDIERAVLLKAQDFASGTPRGLQSMKVGPLSATFSGDAAPDPIVELLAPYRSLG